MRASRDLIAFTALAGIETAGFYGNACPSLVDIFRNGDDTEYRSELREAYIRAGAVSLGLAGIIAWLTESGWPLAAWGIGAGGWIGVCEASLPEEHRLWAPLLGQAHPPYIDAHYRVLDS